MNPYFFTIKAMVVVLFWGGALMQATVAFCEEAGGVIATSTNKTDRSYLTKAWNLDNQISVDASQLGRLAPYRQTYALINVTGRPNRQPNSGNAGSTPVTPYDNDALEAKFQFSFKANIVDRQNLDFLGIKTIRLWGAYTQQSNWQVFNTRNSSPLRESIFEPELMATLGTGMTSGLKLINIGWVHQSNGRSAPESRSWHRVYLLGGWEWNDTTSIMLRAWRRLPERSSADDNPDITDFLGEGDLVWRWEPSDNSQSVALLLRNNLKETDNRGFAQIDWATPIKFGNAGRTHLQFSSGYGNGLLDYNYRQNTLGFGVSFREW